MNINPCFQLSFLFHSMLISIFFCLNSSLCYLNKTFFPENISPYLKKTFSAKINSYEHGCLNVTTHISCIMLTVKFCLLYLIARFETLLHCARILQLLSSAQRQILKSQKNN